MDSARNLRAIWPWCGAAVAVVLVLLAANFASGGPGSFNLFKLYLPRELCMLQESGVIWTHVVSDAIIALAYYSIPLALIYFVRRRGDLTFGWMFVCFAAFILACGTTHVMNVVAIWYPVYQLDGVIKVGTALVSLATATMLWPLLPKALALPSPSSLRLANAELAREIDVRRQAEQSLREMQVDLERRVRERTEELHKANLQLRAEIVARSAAELEREKLLERERLAREEAERASRMKDDFLATLSHELRTPMSAISGWTHLLLESVQEPSEVGDGLRVIERNARIQTRLIDELLDMSRIQTGKLRVDIQPVDMVQVVEAALTAIQPGAAAKGLEVQKELPPEPAIVQGDPARLQQVAWNLLSNAIKFTPRGGRVGVRLGAAGSAVELVVEDSGCGIRPEFLPHVFERFSQADSSITRRHGGLGLGLAIVRHLVELHGGSVGVASAGENRGSAFSVRLPIPVVVADLGRIESAPPMLGHRLDWTTVLLVDDDADTREVLARILQRSGARVFVATDASQALDLLEQHRPSVILSDIGMPEEDGFSLIRRLRRLPPEKGGLTPAVALTALARGEERVRILASGFQAHLCKPVDPPELIAVLSKFASPSQRSTAT